MEQKELEESGAAAMIVNYMGMIAQNPAVELAYDIIKPLFDKGFTRENFKEIFEVDEDETKRVWSDMILLAAFNKCEYQKAKAEERAKLEVVENESKQ